MSWWFLVGLASATPLDLDAEAFSDATQRCAAADGQACLELSKASYRAWTRSVHGAALGTDTLDYRRSRAARFYEMQACLAGVQEACVDRFVVPGSEKRRSPCIEGREGACPEPSKELLATGIERKSAHPVAGGHWSDLVDGRLDPGIGGDGPLVLGGASARWNGEALILIDRHKGTRHFGRIDATGSRVVEMALPEAHSLCDVKQVDVDYLAVEVSQTACRGRRSFGLVDTRTGAWTEVAGYFQDLRGQWLLTAADGQLTRTHLTTGASESMVGSRGAIDARGRVAFAPRGAPASLWTDTVIPFPVVGYSMHWSDDGRLFMNAADKQLLELGLDGTVRALWLVDDANGFVLHPSGGSAKIGDTVYQWDEPDEVPSWLSEAEPLRLPAPALMGDVDTWVLTRGGEPVTDAWVGGQYSDDKGQVHLDHRDYIPKRPEHQECLVRIHGGCRHTVTYGPDKRIVLEDVLEIQAPDGASRALTIDYWSVESGPRDVYAGDGRWLLNHAKAPPEIFVAREGEHVVYTAPSSADPLVWTPHTIAPVQIVDEAGLPLAGQLIEWKIAGAKKSKTTDLEGRVPVAGGASLAGALLDLGTFGPLQDGVVRVSRPAPKAELAIGAPLADVQDLLGRWASPVTPDGRSRVEFITPGELGQAALVGGRLKLGEKRELIVLDADHIAIDERWRVVKPEPTALVRGRPDRVRNTGRWLTPQFGFEAGDAAVIRTTIGEGEVVESLVVEADGEALALRRTVVSADKVSIAIVPRGVRVSDGHYAGIGDPRADKEEAFEQVLGIWGRVGGLWNVGIDLDAWEFSGFTTWLLEGGLMMDRQLERDVPVHERWHWSDGAVWDVDLVYTGREACFAGGPKCAVVGVVMQPVEGRTTHSSRFELAIDPLTLRPHRQTWTKEGDEPVRITTWSWE